MNIPFSLPLIDQPVIDEVLDCLTNTGWLTSGPKVLQFEEEVRKLSGAAAAVGVNSWTSGAMLALRWFGVGPGDEVIIPAYTYSATALCALNIGATVVMVDVGDDFNLDPAQLARALTPRTKAVIRWTRSPRASSPFPPTSWTTSNAWSSARPERGGCSGSIHAVASTLAPRLRQDPWPQPPRSGVTKENDHVVLDPTQAHRHARRPRAHRRGPCERPPGPVYSGPFWPASLGA